ncbi:MAG: penicillin-binding protein 1C [Saprospiraceae bacterium]|nr:penicillin-binding protein 1C [Saprospiraceae bacterium]
MKLRELGDRFRFFFKKHRFKIWLATLIMLVAYWFCLPDPLYNDPTCMVLEARDGSLLGARISADGQWRFPHNDYVPDKFQQAIIEFEDRRFHRHPGFDPFAFGRAMRQNLKNRSVVSGGSTLSMQVIRMARKGKSRNIFQKIIEIVLATRLELRYTKAEIMAFYASNAPFGGNVVGLDAASWRYFGKSPQTLSWGEAATLAVLPNSPALIHPGRNRNALFQKRNRLLKRLLEKGAIDQTSFQLAVDELLPEKPHPLPRLAPHLLDRAFAENFKKGDQKFTKIATTIDPALQARLNELALRKSQNLKSNQIHNLAIVVLEVESGNVLAYVGNAPNTGPENGEDVDIIKAPRSTGSILKPLLYAMMLNEGMILPKSLVTDIPTQISGYKPENYMETYDGVVPASLALSRSLNVPFIRLLQNYSVEKFHFNLKKLGMTTLNQPPKHYGLTLALGGAEGSLWDLTSIYASMARTLGFFYKNSGQYRHDGFRMANYQLAKTTKTIGQQTLLREAPMLSADAIWYTFEAMEELERPTSQGEWERFESSRSIAWKTGTSFGFRDAWAIGLSPKYVVGVWAGNADGEGRPGLVGVYAAAPILFDVFNMLPASNWFNPPYDAMKKMVVCKQSGFPALDYCERDTVYANKKGVNAPPCPFHQSIHLDASRQWQVNSSCESPLTMQNVPWFVLPPVEEYYFKLKNPGYQPLPPFREDCAVQEERSANPMQLIYPRKDAKIFVPIDLDGNIGRTVFKMAHRNPETVVYWHLDNVYMGQTKTFHELELNPAAGLHKITLVDEKGNRLELEFEVAAKN